ncbi:MAG: diguanylate cyclase [Magnetococcales bacterium]|nr:diguanylate cyclase [Magnetococcales bacterium]
MSVIEAKSSSGDASPAQPLLDGPVEIAPRVWWVGSLMPGDPFQCHVYLIEEGDQSVLIDPGSVLLFAEVQRKIERILPFDNIRYFICQHQDPDITGVLPHVDRLVSRTDAVVVSHWRINALLKHYALRLPLMCIEANGWELRLGDRLLRFVFTPYLHSPGAFCTFDTATGTLFSSDLFGGFTEKAQLYAADEGVLEGIRSFHEHYMPSREILLQGLLKLEKLPLRLIAPQHGSLLRSEMIPFIFSRLKELDCGIFLMSYTNTDVNRLVQLNKLLRQSMEQMVLSRDFSEVVKGLLASVTPIMPVCSLVFYGLLDDQVVRLGPETHYRGAVVNAPAEYRAFLSIEGEGWKGPVMPVLLLPVAEDKGVSEPGLVNELVIPLFSPERHRVNSVAVLGLSERVEIEEETLHILQQLGVPLGVAVEREMILHTMNKERERFYQISTRDQLTGLYTRFYMRDSVARLCDLHDRGHQAGLAVAAFDIDHFKRINDTFGHPEGDVVLKRVAGVLLESVRSEDVPVRMGGEEFVIFLIGDDRPGMTGLTERILERVRQLSFTGVMAGERVTISCGLAFRRLRESLDQVMQRADMALYEAKHGGRDRVHVDR